MDFKEIIKEVVETLIGEMRNLPQGIVNALIEILYNMLKELIEGMLGLVVELLRRNPDISVVYGLHLEVVGIITSFYALVFVLSGIAIILSSIMDKDVGRTFREWVLGSIMGIVLTLGSWEIYGWILGLEEAMVQEVFTNVELSGIIMAGAISILLFFIDFTLLLGVIVMLITRSILVLVFCVFFPITIFLFLFPPTRKFGGMFLNMTLIALFLPFFWALLIRISLIAFASMSPSFGGIFNALFGISVLALLYVLPVMLLKIGLSFGGMWVTISPPKHTVQRVVARAREVQVRVSRFRRKPPTYIG